MVLRYIFCWKGILRGLKQSEWLVESRRCCPWLYFLNLQTKYFKRKKVKARNFPGRYPSLHVTFLNVKKVTRYSFPETYRYFSIASKVIVCLSDRCKIFTAWLWIEVCQNVQVTSISLEINQSRIFARSRPATGNSTRGSVMFS